MYMDETSICVKCGEQTSGYSFFGDNGQPRCKDCVLEAVEEHFDPKTHYIKVELKRKPE